MDAEVGSLMLRVAKLERHNRRLKLVGLGVALCIGILMLAGAAKTPKTVEAQKIVLRDRQGHARVTISTPAFAGPAVDTNPDDPVIWLTDHRGTDRAMLTPEGLFFASGKAKRTLDLTGDPRPALKFFDPDGKVLWSAP